MRGLGVNIVDDGPFRAGLALNYRPGRTSSDSDRLRGLPDISGAPSIRGFVTYSIKPAQSVMGGQPLTAYTPGSGLSTVGLTSTGIYALTPHWAIATRVGFQDLIGAPAKDGPLTQRTFGASIGVGALYRFK